MGQLIATWKMGLVILIGCGVMALGGWILTFFALIVVGRIFVLPDADVWRWSLYLAVIYAPIGAGVAFDGLKDFSVGSPPDSSHGQ